MIGNELASRPGSRNNDSTPPDVASLLQSYRRRETTVRAVVETALARAEAATAEFNAFAHLDVDGALSAAEALDRGAGDLVGPLHGVPVAVKDVIDVADLPITGGSRHLAGRRACCDAVSVADLRAAGAVVVGITVTHELAYGPTGDRSAHGPVRNPQDPTRIAGGSSAGSAVAVATGAVPLSLGTDTGGSIRIPAALSGVLGLKPTYGAVSTGGTVPLAPTLDHVGLHASTLHGLRAGLTVLRGSATPSHSGPLRAAWLEPDPTPASFEAIEELRAYAREALGDLGRAVLPAQLGTRIRDDFYVIQGAEAYAQHAHRVEAHPDLYDAEVLERLEAAARHPAWRYAQAVQRRGDLQRRVLRLFDAADVLVTPTTPIRAPYVDERTIGDGPNRQLVRDVLLSRTHQWNLLGFPALSVPVDTPGLPLGLQLIAPPHREDRLLVTAELVLAAQHQPTEREIR